VNAIWVGGLEVEADSKLEGIFVVLVPKVDVIGDGPGDPKEPDVLPKVGVGEKLDKVFFEGAEDVPNGLVKV